MTNIIIAASGSIDTISASSFENAVKGLGLKILINNNPTWWLVESSQLPQEIYSVITEACGNMSPQNIHVFLVSSQYPPN